MLRRVITGDFDHNGNADVAFLRSTPGSAVGPTAIIVYYGKGDGTFSQAVTAAVLDRNYIHLIAADLNGDGLSDFVLSTTEGNDYRGTAISIVHSLPGHKFSGETNLVAGAGFAAMAVADFTRDGLPDLPFTNGQYANSLVLLTNTGTPSITLTSSANPSEIGQPATFTATVSAPGDLTVLPHPGTITFAGLPGGNVTAPITFAGGSGKPFTATVTYETADLPVGSTVITASYPGNSLLNPASGSLTQVVNPPPIYQLVASPTALTVKAGATTNNTVTIAVKSLYGFAGSVSLSCNVTYAGSGTATNPPTCAFANNPLPVNGSAVSTQLILSTTAASSAARWIADSRNPDQTGLALLAGAFLLLLPAGLRYRWPAAVMVLVIAGSVLPLVSCGGTATASLVPPTSPQPPTSPIPPSGPSGTQAGSYIVTVSATSDTAVAAPPPVTIQLTVN
jgi:Bacterial Ig-like domain (group 3)/FG-GAP-like repeat